jgi:hypothetical protein
MLFIALAVLSSTVLQCCCALLSVHSLYGTAPLLQCTHYCYNLLLHCVCQCTVQLKDRVAALQAAASKLARKPTCAAGPIKEETVPPPTENFKKNQYAHAPEQVTTAPSSQRCAHVYITCVFVLSDALHHLAYFGAVC